MISANLQEEWVLRTVGKTDISVPGLTFEQCKELLRMKFEHGLERMIFKMEQMKLQMEQQKLGLIQARVLSAGADSTAAQFDISTNLRLVPKFDHRVEMWASFFVLFDTCC